MQERLADRSGVEVRVCHYPRGCSKYNPIEHRLFGFISLNWAGEPLRSLEAMLGFIRDTTTTRTAGLKVKAVLNEKIYAEGRRVSEAEMKLLDLEAGCFSVKASSPRASYSFLQRSSTL